MANARDIKNRISSVQNTQKITNAMYLISSTKLRKARAELENTRPYFNMIETEIKRIFQSNKTVNSRYFYPEEGRHAAENYAYLVVTADKGLAGAYNHNVIKLAEKKINEDGPDMLFIVGQLGRHYFEKKDIPIDIDFRYTAQNPSMNRARHIAGKLLELFLEGRIDDLYVVYTQMVNSMSVETVCRKILPLKAEKIATQENELVDTYENAQFYPDPKTVFDIIVPDYVTGFIYGALVESFCCEHQSRMMAMQTATDSASDMIKELTVKYNRARQAAITQEITEVVGGARKKKQQL
jgi:F-type H+-transporting ATPase subunit gamma